MELGYWNYYDENFDWNVSSDLVFPYEEYTVSMMKGQGLSEDEALRFYKSGYVCVKDHKVLIDRFYGGALLSYDLCTRFPISEIHTLKENPKSRVWVKKAKSLNEVKSIVAETKDKYNIVFRGQNRNHTINREFNNPYYTIPELGEVSLLPSLWRKMYNANPSSFTNFYNLSLFEWSHIFYSAFDMDEIERRHKALLEKGELVLGMSDMEECSDELLREFGKFRMDLSMGLGFNFATTLSTMLQHYGLYSPVLDLTESLEVALFFATHKYSCSNGISNYQFLGSNSKQAVIYLIDFNKNEMEKHDERSELLKYLEPLRPKTQKCVISRSSSFAINLPAYFLRGIIFLDFDINTNISGVNTEDIFPDKNKDKFLKAMTERLFKKEHITVFT